MACLDTCNIDLGQGAPTGLQTTCPPASIVEASALVAQILMAEGKTIEQMKNSLQLLEKFHTLKLQLCDQLELIADSLPHKVDIRSCVNLSQCLVPTVRQAQLIEEKQFFPIVCSVFENDGQVHDSLDRLCNEHLEDDAFAEEIAGLLHHCGGTGRAADPETAGYMLRGFFSSLRRHIAFERECLIPLLQRTLQITESSSRRFAESARQDPLR